MNPEEVFKPIVDAIKAHPECKHVKCAIDGQSMNIIGKYSYISMLICDDDGTIMNNIGHIVLPNNLAEIHRIISLIRSETRPNDTYHTPNTFYEANFPCLAEELGYMTYKKEIEFGYAIHMQADKLPIEVVYPALCHWDLLAFERKVHAVLDGSQLPLPIRNEIFSLFYID